MEGIGEIPLEEGLDLRFGFNYLHRKLTTTGSVLQINADYDDYFEETENTEHRNIDFIGQPVGCFEVFTKQLTNVDENGLVKKKIIEAGGGVAVNESCTVSIAYSGFWENEDEPFDVQKFMHPLVVDLKDNGLLPGLEIAVKSMLVGEISVFWFSYKVMYGEFGIPPRIKPRADCIFYMKLIKSIFTPQEGKLDLREPNMFERVNQEVKLLYSSGATLFKSKNYNAAVQLFRKGTFLLHKCRLADENEEKRQEKLLIKLYINLAICYNNMQLPLKACTCCNELNRLKSLWNNSKALFQNAKALRMIGDFEQAKKKLRMAMKLAPNNNDIKSEFMLLEEAQILCNKSKLLLDKNKDLLLPVSEEFRKEVDDLIKNFKENVNLCKMTLPKGLRASEIDYVREACVRENLFCTKIQTNYALDKENEEDLPTQ